MLPRRDAMARRRLAIGLQALLNRRFRLVLHRHVDRSRRRAVHPDTTPLPAKALHELAPDLLFEAY